MPTLPRTDGPGDAGWWVSASGISQPRQPTGRKAIICHAPLLCLTDGLLPQKPETCHPRQCDQHLEWDIATSPVQSERLVKALQSLPGGALGHVPDLCLGHLLCLHPHAAPPVAGHHLRCILLQGKSVSVVWGGEGQSSWSQAEKLLCSILHTESSTGVVSRFPLPTLSTPISRSQTPTHTPVLHVSHWLTVLAERADAHTAVSPLTCPWCRETAPGEEGCRGPRHWGRWRSGPLQLSQGCTGSVRVIQQGKVSLIRKDRSTYSSRLLSPGSVRGVLWSPVPSSDFPRQLSHGWLWRFASEVLPGGRALWGTRRHLPLQLCSVLEGGLESVSVVRSSCDVSPFVGGSQASSPLVAA